MSKIYDVEKMYGQDFNIVTTNAPSNIIKQGKKLIPNTFLISSPEDTNNTGQDNNYPAMFVTDFNAQPLQLTYPLFMKNGLNYSNEYGYAFINIDHKTIITENTDGSGALQVNTDNLTSASFNNKGVVKLSEENASINRNLNKKFVNESLSKYNNTTFIKINDDGILYLDDSFIDLINDIVNLKVKNKLDSIKIMLNNNLKMWIQVTTINSNENNAIYNIGSSTDSIELDSNKPSIITFDLHYYSFNNESESIEIKYDNIPNIFKIELEESTTTVVHIPNNDELYEHVVENIKIVFIPNYFIVNNSSITQNNAIPFIVDDIEYGTLQFNQSDNNIFNDNNDDNLIKLEDIDNLHSKIRVNDIIGNNDKIIFTETINNDKKDYFTNPTYTTINYEDKSLDLFTFYMKTYFKGKNDINYELFSNKISSNSSNDYSLQANNPNLKNFINLIVNTKQDSNNTKYELNNTEDTANNYVNTEIQDDETYYYINLVTDLLIYKNNSDGSDSSKNSDPISTWSKTYKLELKLEYIYNQLLIYINSNSAYSDNNTNIQNKINIPDHFYYESRSNNGRLYLNEQSEYNGSLIDPSILYCIITDDMNYYDSTHDNAYFRINNSGYKLIKYGEDENTNEIIPYSLIKLDYDSYNIEIKNEYIKFDLGNDDTRVSNLYKLLSEGLTIPVKVSDENNIQRQIIKLNVNVLELILDNMSVKQIGNNNYISLSVYNESNPNDSDYYSMNNYTISNNINNNEIEFIKFVVPYYIIQSLSNSLSNSNYMNMTFGFDSETQSNNSAVIQLTQSNGQINTIISSNLPDDILTLENTTFNIDFNDRNNNYIIIKHKNSATALPKLSSIKFNFSFNDEQTYKICYFEDTDTPEPSENDDDNQTEPNEGE